MINVKLPSSRKRTFSKKLEVHRTDLYRIAWSWCHNTELADDLVQETYAKALKNRSQLNDIAKLKPWLARILVNLHKDYLRDKKEQISIEENILQTRDDPCDFASRDESVQLVRMAISQLNEKHQKIISLIDIAEFSYIEVSESLDIPVGTVMSRLSRARKNLSTILYELENPPELSSTPSAFLRRVK